MTKIVQLHPDAVLPQRATDGAAGLDLVAREAWLIAPGERALVKTGVGIELSPNLCALVCPRSGLAATHGVTVLNAPGVIDADYRGEIGVCLVNLGREPFAVDVGDRIAQLLIVPVMPEVQIAEALSDTARGAGGWGSTG